MDNLMGDELLKAARRCSWSKSADYYLPSLLKAENEDFEIGKLLLWVVLLNAELS